MLLFYMVRIDGNLFRRLLEDLDFADDGKFYGTSLGNVDNSDDTEYQYRDLQ